MIADKHLELLIELGTREVRHSNRTLYDHLLGTHGLLERWGNPPEVCLLGLFHSVYGTQTFDTRSVSPDDRATIQAALASEVERLVYVFGVTNRDEFFEQIGSESVRLHDQVHGCELTISPHDLHRLVEVEVANILEQVPHKQRISKGVRRIYMEQCERAKNCISTNAYQHYRHIFAIYNQSESSGDGVDAD